MSIPENRGRYGVDAPGIVRALFAAGVGLAFVGAVCGFLLAHHHQSVTVRFLRDNGFVVGGCLLLAGCWMLLSSLWLKQRLLEQLLDQRTWRGDETVLDVGCGRGMVAIGAAKRIGDEGRVVGVDLWDERDLSGNTAAEAERNATIAGVSPKVTFGTGDARRLPYANESYDVVASMTAIHNIPDAAGRRTAIEEIWRVTKAGGQILIFDIKHARTYAAQLRAFGANVKLRGPHLLWGIPGWRLSALKAKDRA